jgi:hypothetical protein
MVLGRDQIPPEIKRKNGVTGIYAIGLSYPSSGELHTKIGRAKNLYSRLDSYNTCFNSSFFSYAFMYCDTFEDTKEVEKDLLKILRKAGKMSYDRNATYGGRNTSEWFDLSNDELRNAFLDMQKKHKSVNTVVFWHVNEYVYVFDDDIAEYRVEKPTYFPASKTPLKVKHRVVKITLDPKTKMVKSERNITNTKKGKDLLTWNFD